MLQMKAFRQAWSGIACVLVIDPVILATSNNRKAAPYEMLREAFPEMQMLQPREAQRAVLTTPKYFTPPFAEELGGWLRSVEVL